MMDEMAEAYRRDYAKKARIDTLRTLIRDFLDESERTPIGLDAALRAALAALESESAFIVRRWD